ncbi:MAG: hypothetical protein AAGI46_02940 [Planctomycetota bacterium]
MPRAPVAIPKTRFATMPGDYDEDDATASRPAVFVVGKRAPMLTPEFDEAEPVGDAFNAILRLTAVSSGAGRPRLLVSLATLPANQRAVVRAAKRVRPDAEVLLFDCGLHSALLAELVLQGADGIIDDDGTVRRFGQSHDVDGQTDSEGSDVSDSTFDTGPVLTAAELAALLDDLP